MYILLFFLHGIFLTVAAEVRVDRKCMLARLRSNCLFNPAQVTSAQFGQTVLLHKLKNS